MPLVIMLVFAFPAKVTSQDNDTYLSEEIQGYCIEIGEEYGICPELLMSIIETESHGQTDVESGGCVGLMQISQRWHTDRMERLGVTDIFDERSNILVGADYLSELRGKYGDVATCLMVYNGTSDAVERGESGDLTQYATNILERSTELEEIHNGNDNGTICSAG